MYAGADRRRSTTARLQWLLHQRGRLRILPTMLCVRPLSLSFSHSRTNTAAFIHHKVDQVYPAWHWSIRCASYIMRLTGGEMFVTAFVRACVCVCVRACVLGYSVVRCEAAFQHALQSGHCPEMLQSGFTWEHIIKGHRRDTIKHSWTFLLL